MTSTFSERLKQALTEKGLRAADVSRLTGLSKARLSQYTNGVYEAKQDALRRLAEALDVSETWLMGMDVPMERNKGGNTHSLGFLDTFFETPITKKRYPVLGKISCGAPVFAEEDSECEYIDGFGDIDADFCLRASGDSMIGARIFDGDMVFIKKSEMVDNGQIAAVLIDDEATLKRVYYYPESSKLILNPENPRYEPLVYIGIELDSIRILGRAVAFMSKIK